MLTSSATKYFIFLLWVSFVYFTAILIFTSGFLLRRQVLSNKTDCSSTHCSQPTQLFSKAVILVVDALKYDFCVYNSSLASPGYSQNKLPVLEEHSRGDPRSGLTSGKLFRFLADPPTTTMQRLKGLTTGSLPTFIDVSSNFASAEISEDNIIDQLVNNAKRVVFAGDDTWTSLFPTSFTKSFPQPSFDVWDLDTVDTEVNKVLFDHLKSPNSWDVFIGHFLGVDHAGHKYGPDHPEMSRKLGEMNTVISDVIQALPADTVLFVFGDHGMTSSGDHGGDSESEVTAGMFVYSPSLAMRSGRGQAVAQIDLVPSLSLLLGVPIPFSNLGAIIEDFFVPTTLLRDKHHVRHVSYSSEDLVNFRLPYIKNNVHQVHRYLTAYLNQGGTFPEASNSRIRQLASQVINKPGALSHKQLVDLLTNSRTFLTEARRMCQSVWVEFNLPAMSHSLNLLLLHSCVLSLVILKPPTRLLSMLISSVTLLVSLLVGGFVGVTVFCLKGFSFYPLVTGFAAAASILAQGVTLLWKLRQSLLAIVKNLVRSASPENLVLVLVYCATLCLNFSNSFVVLQADVLNFLTVTVLLVYVYRYRLSSQALYWGLLSLLGCGLLQLSSLYVRCREEQGQACVNTQFHKPLSTLPQSDGSYKNWRYFFTNFSLLLTCCSVHYILRVGGNLNGISVPVLVAGYFPWFISLTMSSYWALQAFPTKLISAILPWQQNLLAQLVMVLSCTAILTLVINPKLVYLIPKKRRLNSLVPKQENVATYFNYLKSHWKTSLTDSQHPMAVAYGLGTCLSAVVISVTIFLSLLSMLVLGDGQAPAICLHLAISAVILGVTTPARLSPDLSTSSLFQVPGSVILLWFLLDSLAFFTTGHQPTFPHIQWSAAFVGFAGSEFGGDSWLGHIIPITLVGWNTFSTVIISGVSLPLLLLAPPFISLHLPSLRPPARLPQSDSQNMIGEDFFTELSAGEAIFLDRAEETRGALLVLSCQYLAFKAVKMISSVLAAAVLRRHLMVWKIFAPNFIFEAVGFCVSLVSVLTGFLIFNRTLSVLTKWYCKIQKQ